MEKSMIRKVQIAGWIVAACLCLAGIVTATWAIDNVVSLGYSLPQPTTLEWVFSVLPPVLLILAWVVLLTVREKPFDKTADGSAPALDKKARLARLPRFILLLPYITAPLFAPFFILLRILPYPGAAYELFALFIDMLAMLVFVACHVLTFVVGVLFLVYLLTRTREQRTLRDIVFCIFYALTWVAYLIYTWFLLCIWIGMTGGA